MMVAAVSHSRDRVIFDWLQPEPQSLLFKSHRLFSVMAASILPRLSYMGLSESIHCDFDVIRRP